MEWNREEGALGRRDQHLLLQVPSSGSWGEQWGLPSAPSLQTTRTQSSQPLLTGAPSPFTSSPALLWTHLIALHMLLKLWGPEVHTVLEGRPHQHWMQQDKISSADQLVFDADQDSADPDWLCCRPEYLFLQSSHCCFPVTSLPFYACVQNSFH